MLSLCLDPPLLNPSSIIHLLCFQFFLSNLYLSIICQRKCFLVPGFLQDWHEKGHFCWNCSPISFSFLHWINFLLNRYPHKPPPILFSHWSENRKICRLLIDEHYRFHPGPKLDLDINIEIWWDTYCLIRLYNKWLCTPRAVV